jgi:hypothetical protein
MAKAKTKKTKPQFNQYMVDFEFYFMTSFTKQKSVIKLQLFSPLNSPDESVSYVYSILQKSFEKAFNKPSFNKNVVRFRKISYFNELPIEFQKNNLGLTDEEKIDSISSIFKKHMLA